MEKDVDKDNTNENKNDDLNEDPSNTNIDGTTLKEMGELLSHKSKYKKGDIIKDEYKFWGTQPVNDFKHDEIKPIGPIDVEKSVDDVQKLPYKLPTNFSWHDVNIKDKKELNMVTF